MLEGFTLNYLICCVVYAYVPTEVSQSIFLFWLHNSLSAFVFIKCLEALQFRHISGIAALINFTGQPVRSQSDTLSG